MIQRFIQRVGEPSDIEASPRLTVDDLVSTPRSGLLVAEGGMGKSTFLKDFAERVGDKAAFIKLAYFAQNPQGLANKIEGAAKADPGHTLIFDGMDEAVDLAGTLCQCVKELPDDIFVWISSRECRQLATVSEALKKLVRYRLLPFSRDDVGMRVKEKKLDVCAVEDLLREHDLWNICGNPMGCEFVLKTFKRNNGRNAWTTQEFWRQGILSLCDEPNSETKSLDKNAGQFSVDQVYACAAWIALNLNLSGKNAVFTGVRETECPSQALPVSALVSEGAFSCELIESTLPRGVFLPWGGERSGFAHATYSDYLAAVGFRKHVPRDQWESLLLDRDNRCLFPQRIPVTQWLMTGHPDLADEVFEIEPENFLTAALVSSRRAPLCQVLLARAENMDDYWRSARCDMPFHLLKSEATWKTLSDFFSGVGCDINESSCSLAVHIAMACGYFDLLADFALEDRNPSKLRVIAAFGVCRAPREVRWRLRPLLDRLTELDVDDEFDHGRGALLRACWPDLLSPGEVLQYLVPGRCSGVDSYSMFLAHGFVVPFLERLDASALPDSLTWAVRQFQWLDSRYSVGGLAEIGQIIYTVCWRHAAEMDDGTYISLLADGFLAANARHKAPFHSAQMFNGRKLPDSAWIGQDFFTGHVGLRFAVLQEIIKRGDILKGGGYWLLHGEFPLIRTTKDDLCRLVKILADDPNQAQADLWARVVLSFTAAFLDLNLDDELDRLHAVRPDLFPSTAYERRKEREDYRRECEEAQRKRQEPLEKDEADRLENQRSAERWIKEWLADDRVAVKKFPIITDYITLKDGRLEDWSGVDMRQSPGWKKLTPVEQDMLVVSAERFLKESPPSEFSPRTSSLEWHKALVWLKACNREAYDALPESVWCKCAVEVLNFVGSDYDAHNQGLLDDLSERFPNVAKDAIIRLLSLDDESFVLHHWGKRLTREQAEAVLSSRFTPESEVCGGCTCFSEFPATHSHTSTRLVCDQILSDLAKYQPDVVRRWVNERLHDRFDVCLSHPFYDVLRRYALQLDADKHFPAFLQTLIRHADWGRRWLETSAISPAWHDLGGYRNAILSRSAEEIGVVYEWLDSQYPTEESPRRESGDIAVSRRDRIYDFKMLLFTNLVQSGKSGSARIIEKLLTKNPEGFVGHVATAQRNEAAARLPVLPADRIRELTDEKKAVIASVHDLQRYVLALLKNYQVLLHGTPPAVGHLWNTNEPVSPKKEEDVSDHLVLYLKDKRAGAIFANREVQISHKLAKDGETGTRTDIWIDCETICQEKVSLCIEVKCSWNPSSKTAIADQLVAKYMSPGRADAGILLLACFHCAAWKTEKKSVWPSLREAREDLEQQAKVKSAEIGKPVDAFVLDCTL